jgi:hypothetical protein
MIPFLFRFRMMREKESLAPLWRSNARLFM